MKKHRQLLRQRSRSYFAGEDLVDVFLEIPCCCASDRGTVNRPSAHLKHIVSCWRGFEPELESFSEEERNRLCLASGGAAFNVYAIVGRTLHYRWFYTTTQGYAGVCPCGTQPGDLIVVLFGGRVPFILRETPVEDLEHSNWKLRTGKRSSRRPCYQLIGETYLHGCMEGEDVERQRCTCIPNELFDIR